MSNLVLQPNAPSSSPKRPTGSRGHSRLSHAIAGIGVALAAALASPIASAGPYTNEYVFGDSLSDNGNLAELYQQNFPNPPSYHDSFTNGPVAVSGLATQVGLSLTPSLWVSGFKDIHNLFGGASYVPGTNYAVAGATSALSAVGGPMGINLPQQVAAFGAYTAGKADPNALYVVMIGGNDVRNAALSGTGLSGVASGVQAELASIQTLLAEGARDFLVVNVPNVGIIPEFAQDTPTLAAAATQYSQAYDASLATGLKSLIEPLGTDLTLFDLYGFNSSLLANAAAEGFSNTTDRCFTSTPFSAATTVACGPNGANIDQFVYWDSIHPTSRVQAAWAGGFESALGVPEPSSVALLALGLVGLAGASRRRRAR